MTLDAPRTSQGILNPAELRRAVWTLCLTETVSYGVLYYAFLVLNPSIVADTGWNPTSTMLAFSLGQVVAALGGVAVGRWIDQHGPRVVMTAGSIMAVPSLCLVALAANEATFLVAWLLAGVAMAAVFYTPAFSAISHWGGGAALRGLTAITLMAGFASTIFGPLAAWLDQVTGWRTAFIVLALLLAVSTVPLHWFGLRSPWVPRPGDPQGTTQPDGRRSLTRPFVMLAIAMSLAVLAEYGTLAQLVPLLIDRGLEVGTAALILGVGGAGQVAGRIFYAPVSARTSLAQRTVGLFLLIAVTTAMFVIVPARVEVLLLVAVVAGAARGCVTLLLATAVPDRWGVLAIGRRNGLLSAPVMTTAAVAPFLTALISAQGGETSAFYVLAAAALAAAVLAPATLPPRSALDGCG